MAEPKTKQQAKAQPKAEKFKVRSVVGLMIHPYTPYRFDMVPVELFEIDSWVQCQIDAGKLELC